MTEIIPLLSNEIDSNCYLILDDECALIDTGTGNNDWLVNKIEEKVDLDEISVIINTHGHADHCGGNTLFDNARIMAHTLDVEELMGGGLYGTIMFLKDFDPLKVKVDKKLKDGDIVSLGKTMLRVIHTPGHTPGSICLLEEKRRILFSGDTLFAGGGFGRVDLGGDATQMLNSLKELSNLNFNLLYPGHGGVVDNGRKHAQLALRYAEEFLI